MIRLAVRVAREEAEPVLAELLALSPGGLEERDVDAGTVEYALYGAPGELPDMGELRAVAAGALVDVSSSEVSDGSRWRDWHRPVDVGPLRVRPPWEPARPGALDVVIDPGQAFGTGAHPTTRLSLELLTTLTAEGALADWGCGSGVLALAAARLGYDPVLACDHERESVAATLAAAATNDIHAVEADDFGAAAGPAARGRPAAAPAARGRPAAAPAARRPSGVVAGRLDLLREPGPWAPTVTANLVRPLLLEVAARMERVPERLIASGLEHGEAEEVAAGFARRGLRLADRRDGGGWTAILMTR